jgi:hypothetical protein
MYVNALLYGSPGTGKTIASLGAARFGRVLLIDAEGGAKTLALHQHGVPTDQIDVWPENPGELTFEGLESLILQLHGMPGAYSTIVVDSISELTRRLLEVQIEAARARSERLGKTRDRWAVELADYGVVSSQFRLLLRRLRDLPVNLVLTALERRDMDDDGMVSYGPAVSPAIAIDTMGLVDIVGSTSVEEIGGQTFYLASFVPVNRRRAKDRLGVLPPRLVDPSIDRILGYINGTLDRASDPRQQAVRAALSPTPTPIPEMEPEPEVVYAS